MSIVNSLVRVRNCGTSHSSRQVPVKCGRKISLKASTPSMESVQKSSSYSNFAFIGVHHVGLLCKNVETSLKFYRDILGLQINPNRPDSKLPYRGAWLWVGSEMIHLMELPNPDPMSGRPSHGGRDRHFCLSVDTIQPIVEKLQENNIKFTMSQSGRSAVFFRDPDMNCLEIGEMGERDIWQTI